MNNPPKHILSFFRWFCHPDLVKYIEGDLVELYREQIANGSKQKANWLFAWEVVKLFRPSVIRKLKTQTQINNYDMFKHNILVSIRSFHRHKVSFLVNLFGLVAALTTVLFIGLWVLQEVKIDHFHTDNEDLYRLVSDVGGNETLLNTSPRYAKQLAGEIPEIELLVNSSWGFLESNLVVNEDAYPLIGEFASEDFFKLFSYPLIKGIPQSVLAQPNSIVLSESTAIKLFNSVDIVGETVEWRWFSAMEKVVITGVYEDIPMTSSTQFDYVVSFDIFERRFNRQIATGNRNGRTFLKLTKGTDVHFVNNKISEISKRNFPESDMRPPFLIGYADYYLNNQYQNGHPVGGRVVMIRLFVLIGLLILFIACINFMNLSTARAALRTKEIGVKKVMGALRGSLAKQYITESCLMSLLSGLIAVVFVIILFPYFQKLTGQYLVVNIELYHILTFLAVVLITGLLAGSYPAFYLSGFKPLRVLNGQLTSSIKDQWFRKGLIVFQFGMSLVLIVSVLVISHQMKYIQDKDLGYSKEHILNFGTTGMNSQKQQAFLKEVRRLPGVVKASGVSHALFGAQKSGVNISWDEKNPDQDIWFEWGYVGYDMLELLEIELLNGRSFSREFGNEREKVIINETTQKIMGLADPIGRKLKVGEAEYDIIGVSNDFHFQSFHEEIKPTFFLLNNDWSMKLAIRIEPEETHNTIDRIEELYVSVNPGFSFEYSFHDQDHQTMYETEDKMANMSKSAAGLAIFISCLGLFGLMTFVIERKAKELGIRRVLGASSKSLVTTVAKDFTLSIALASILGVAVSAFAMDRWLEGFAYRIELEWWYFAISVFVVYVLAIVTSSTQIIKTLVSNPVNALRDE